MPQVLVVDADPETLNAAQALETEGWSVLKASDSGTCMRLARQERPDLAVVASRLHDGDGAHVVQRLRALLATAVTPILGVASGPAEAGELLTAGAQECLDRPVSPERLSDAVSRHTSQPLSFATAPSFVLEDQQRLSALASSELLDTVPEDDLDRFTRLASRFLDAPTALVSLVDRERQFFKSAVGLHETLQDSRQTPLTHSFCQWAVASREAFVVPDAREEPIVKNSPAIGELDAVSYCGMPIYVRNEPIGTLCVIDSVPRPWSQEQIAVLRDLAGILSSYLDLRSAQRS